VVRGLHDSERKQAGRPHRSPIDEAIIMNERWILVCDASRARIFRDSRRRAGSLAPAQPGNGESRAAEDAQSGFALVRMLEHEESRAKARDLVADANGRKPAGPSMGGSYGGRSVSFGHGRVGVEPDTDPKEVEAQKFAQELAATLERGLLDRAYEALVVAAPPKFLGLLRDTLSKEVSKRIEATLNKDFAKLEAREIEARIRSELAA
jgi:protein required for attachment to host cells